MPKPELRISREFDAPRERAFEVWTTPTHMVQWWGPNGFTLPTCEMDFRAGGAFRMCMRAPGGTDHWFHGTYTEIVPPQRVVFTGVMNDGADHTVVTTVTFTEKAGRTTIDVHQAYSYESDATRGAQAGWTQQFERLGSYLSTL